MKFFTRKSAPAPTPAPVVEPLRVPLELMNARFDRSAGRWCGICKQCGSHHTDRHEEFARAALAAE